MTSFCDKYNEWKRAWNKDALKFYDSKKFRRDYTAQEMDSKKKMFCQHAMPHVKDVLSEIWSTGCDKFRVLSLGCGPGSDLLGILGAVNSVLRSGDGGVGWEAGELRCRCIGVDAFDWNQDTFEQRINNPDFCSMIGQISCRFLYEDMDSFVLDYLQDNSRSKFDFICLSFADAGRNLKLIGTALPHLLSDSGRILVLDNDIQTVRSLVDYGFMCTSAGHNVCMHSRGRGSRLATSSSFRLPSDSPIQRYREEKMLQEFYGL